MKFRKKRNQNANLKQDTMIKTVVTPILTHTCESSTIIGDKGMKGVA